MQEQEESSFDRIKKSLYVRNKVPEQKKRHELHEEERGGEVESSWIDPEERRHQEEILNNPDKMLEELHKGHVFKGNDADYEILREETYHERLNKRLSEKKQTVTSRIIKVVFFASLVFFLITVGVAVYFLNGGKNQVSCDNVGITISGPRSIASGKKLSLDVLVKNDNPVAMNTANIEIVFPEGSRNSDDSSIAITSTKELVGTIERGEQVRTIASAILFGKEQTESEIKAVVTYNVEESDALFTCEEPYRILIATAPVSLTVQGLEEMSSGQEVELELVVTSNSDELVPNVRLVADYPYGFEFISAEPAPVYESSVWDIGDIPQGIERVVKIRGIVKGYGTESRIIGFSVGDKDDANSGGVKTVMQKVEHAILITQPFLELNAALNGDKNAQTTATLGEEVEVVVHWKNTLDTPLHNTEIIAHLDGIMLNPHTVLGRGGFFKSVDNTIIWTPQTINTFSQIPPGEEGDLYFDFNTKHFEKGTNVRNPVMNIDFEVHTHRDDAESTSVTERLLGQAKKTILFDTEVVFDAYALHGAGPFTNTGPHPPKVNTETTYTIALRVENNTNDMESVEVRAELPINVEWVGNTSPSHEKVTYNQTTREVVWVVGEVERGTGYTADGRVAYFQVSTTPSVSQVNSEVILLHPATLQGIDSFTKNVLQRKTSEIRSNLTEDPYFKDVWGAVQL